MLIGANPDWPHTAALCEGSSTRACAQVRNKEYPIQLLTHDPRIGAAVIADPLAIMFTPDSYAAIKVPVQLWASAQGGDGVTPDAVAAVDKALPVAHEYRVVPNSAHFAFLAPCPADFAKRRPQLCSDPPGFDRTAFHVQFNAAILAFFRQQLNQR